ncbi:hypothetical protein OG901_15595 [Streptomyces mirabilis]|uniref:hypothetical protein n=1 Tax=Streptomyces mirabilis TaxID=68239 RepID=UPI002259AB7E|nr:hypothetical protein [Streptomyces mirabilis]MCX5349179.1 hypothetical protein [Streptomyces mirabilis]
MSEEFERRKAPKPAPGSNKPDKPSEDYSFDHSQDLRSRVTRLTFQVLDHIEQTGAVVGGEVNPDIEALCALIDAGTGLRRVALERRLGGAVLEYRAKRPV